MVKRITAAALLIIISIMVYVNMQSKAKMPFVDWTVADISGVTVEMVPLYPEKIVLKDDEIEELVSLLNKIIIYQRDFFYYSRGGGGGAVIYTITKSDGTQDIISSSNTTVAINGAVYASEFVPDENLALLWYRVGL